MNDQIDVRGSCDSDTLTVDYTGVAAGAFVNLIDFQSQGPAASDSLVVTGGAFNSVVHNLVGADNGNLDLDGDASAEITYGGLEPVDISDSSVVDLVLNLPATTDSVELSELGGGDLVLASGVPVTFSSTEFAEPSNSITINAGADAFSATTALDIDADLTINADDVSFSSTIDGGSNLVVNASGTTSFGGVVGGGTALSSLDVNTDGPFVLSVDVSATGVIDVDITSGGFTLDNNAQVNSAGDAIIVNSPSTVTLVSGSGLSAGTDLTINGAGVFSLGGSLQHGGTGTVTGGVGSDIFIIDNNNGTTGDGGTVENILSNITIDGTAGSDSLIVDDSGDASGDVITVDLTSITGLVDSGSVVSYASIESMTFNLGTGDDAIDLDAFGGAPVTDVTRIIANGGLGDDTFDATTGTFTRVSLNGSSPVVPASPGDRLNITTITIDTPIVFPATTDGVFESFVAGNANLPIDWTSIETFFFDGQEFLVGDLYTRGTNMGDRMIYSRSGLDEVSVRINNVYYGPFAVTGTMVVYGEGGRDRITISGNLNQPAELHGGEGVDYLAGGVADDTLFGDDANDTLLTGDGNNTAYGGTGNDIISARGGMDTLVGQNGNDRLYGAGGMDVLIGDDLNDALALGNDRLVGGNGDDLLVGGPGNDSLSGGFGDDVLLGNSGNDLLRGNQGEDFLVGGTGDDGVRGEANRDVLFGGVASLEDSEADLIQLLLDWSTTRDFSAVGTLTSDGDVDGLLGGGAADSVYTGVEDSIQIDANDTLFSV